MKCTQCQNEMRIAPEVVGNDNSGNPIYHRFAYCDICKTKMDIDMAAADPTIKKEESVCGIIGLICSFIFCFILFPIAGFVLSLIGICSKKKKSVCGTIGIIISILAIIFNIIVLKYSEHPNEGENTEHISTYQNTESKNTDDQEEKTSIAEDDGNASKIDVEVLAEYTLPDGLGWYTRHFIVVKNNSSETVDISTSSLAYSEDGTMVSAADGSLEALGAGCTSVFYEAFETDADIDHYETTLNTSKSKYYKSVIQDLSYVQNDIDGGAIFQVTNNGNEAAEFVEGYALFFRDGELVEYSNTYFTDDDLEIKPGKTISKQFDSYENFDRIEFYLTGRK